MSDAIARLVQWRDVGDGPIKYCAGDKEFADDVIAALAEIDRITAERDGLAKELLTQAAEIVRLADERDRTARNRDMWKGQCERQAEQLTKLRKALERPAPEVVAAVQQALMKHPHFSGHSATAFGFANTALDAFAKAALTPAVSDADR